MQKTEIEYLDRTWNPIRMKCSKVSPGCDHCWHLRYARRLAACHTINMLDKLIYAGLEGPRLNEDELNAPESLKKGSRIGVQLMGDLFHPFVPFHMTTDVFNVIIRSYAHQFLILTKRPVRMAKFMMDYTPEYPPPTNAWLGVSVEDQEAADERVPTLQKIWSARKWLSVEPLLGRITFKCLKDIDWVVMGCETGPGARPAEQAWFTGIIAQCQKENIPVFVKKITNKPSNPVIWGGHRQYPEGLCPAKVS